jgi:atypical dual specificity phosphatase
MTQKVSKGRSAEVAPQTMALGSDPAGSLIRIDRLSVGFESNVVLKEVSVDVPRRGVLGIMGPAGVGKSTLLRTLGRWNDLLPSFWAHGNVWFDGQELLQDLDRELVRRRVALLVQKARLYTATILDNAIAEVHTTRPLRFSQKRELAHEALAPLGLWDELEPLLNEEVLSLPLATQRKLSIARLLAGGAQCFLADEPLRDLEDGAVKDLSRFIHDVSGRLPIVMVTHNQKEARELCDTICLMTAGRVIEVTPSSQFFSRPKTALGAQFLEFGSCWPRQGQPPGDEHTKPAWEPAAQERVPRPGGLHWVIVGTLGGMQQPGLLREMEEDLRALARLGCLRLVSLTEERMLPETLEQYGISGEHFPMPDMGVPSLEDAETLCKQVSTWMDDGTPTVFHCKAGLGRTGTMLACTLVYRGDSPVRAIDEVRSINPFYIQSRAQLDFITRFAHHLSASREAGLDAPGLVMGDEPAGSEGALS